MNIMCAGIKRGCQDAGAGAGEPSQQAGTAFAKDPATTVAATSAEPSEPHGDSRGANKIEGDTAERVSKLSTVGTA
jgi:hypothetical protein